VCKCPAKYKHADFSTLLSVTVEKLITLW